MIFKNKGLCHPRGQCVPTLQCWSSEQSLLWHPTHQPQADITATGHCEYWITTIDLMEYQEKSTLSSPDDGTMLPEVYTDTVACTYNVDGKCKGMLTPERLHILQKAFDEAKCSGLHDHVQPLPISFVSELVGLIARKDISTSKHTNKKIKDSFSRILPPPTSPPPFKSGPWSLKKIDIPPWAWPQIPPLLEWAPKRQSVWGKHQCLFLPILWDLHLPSHLPWKHLLLATRHAIYSAAVSTEETATFMLLPSWNKYMTTNPYTSLCRKYPHMCKFLGTIPSNQLQYRPFTITSWPHFQKIN